MSIAKGVDQIYDKRWVARYCQEQGIKVYVDLNVAPTFAEYNLYGVPDGYNAFATRGYQERPEALEYEIDIARKVSGLEVPNMLVFGGGEGIHKICMQAKVCYIPLAVYKRNNE